MIVTLDGPAGAGKSTAARALAQRLGFDFLDTGAMYRAVTLAGLRKPCDFSDQAAVAHLLKTIHLDMPPGKVVLNGEDIAGLIRTPEVTAASGVVASSPIVPATRRMATADRCGSQHRLRRPRPGNDRVSRCLVQILSRCRSRGTRPPPASRVDRCAA